jgi:UDP-N-acetylmuramate: L-alanyl-gamma-D-glutamyl-meso-diaminopimelate ligase
MNLRATSNACSPVITYGTKNADYRIHSIRMERGKYHFTVKNKSWKSEFRCSILGRHNIWNCCAAIILGIHLDLPSQVIQDAVASFQGVERRMRPIREIENTLFLEDFAHHPTSIESLLISLRERYPGKKIVVLFEPRSWSLRRNIFQDRLAISLARADEIGIKEVFQKEKIQPGEVLDVEQIRSKLSEQGRLVRIFNEYDDIRAFISEIDFSRDQVVVLISNGDFGHIPAYVREMNIG